MSLVWALPFSLAAALVSCGDPPAEPAPPPHAAERHTTPAEAERSGDTALPSTPADAGPPSNSAGQHAVPAPQPDLLVPLRHSPPVALRRPLPDLPAPLEAAYQHVQAGAFDQARSIVLDYLNRLPESERQKRGLCEFVLASTYHEQQVYEAARPHFERAIELVPTYHPVYHFYAYCLYNLGEYEVARRGFETHLSYVPEEGDSHFGIGLIDLEEGRLDEAAGRFRTAIELHQRAMAQPYNKKDRRREIAKSHARLGDVALRQGELEQARRELDTAVELWPMHYEAWFMLHTVLLRLGEEDAAAEALRRHDEIREQVRPAPQPGDAAAIDAGDAPR